MSLLFAALNQAAQEHRAAVASQQNSTYAPRVALAPTRQNWLNLGLVLLTGMVGGAALVAVLVAQQPTYSVRDLTNNGRGAVWDRVAPATPFVASDITPAAAPRLPPARYSAAPPAPPPVVEAPAVEAPDTQYGIALNNPPSAEPVTAPPPAMAAEQLATAAVAAAATVTASSTPVPEATANPLVAATTAAEAAPPAVPRAEPKATPLAAVTGPDGATPAPSAPAAKPQAKIEVLLARAPQVKPKPPVANRPSPAAAEDGASAMARGDANAALIAYQAVLDRNPTDKAAQIGKAMALEQTGATAVALAQWRLLANQYPNDPLVMTSYARGLATVDAATARALLQQVLQRSPQFAPALAAQAALDARAGNMDAAQDGQQKAWSLDKANPAHRLNLAIIADKRGEKAQALELYKQAQAAFANGGWKATMPMSWSAVQARVDYLTDYLAKLPPQAVVQ